VPLPEVSSQSPDRERAERRDVVVIGGGQAGLAIGYFLAQQRLDFTILDAGDAPAEVWRRRWDSLKLSPLRATTL
jgi:cation diffusion facilitator CzcD-associated flavoprotein CzcO